MRIKLEGDKALSAKLRKCQNLDVVKTIVQKNGDDMNRQMKANTKSAFKKGYATGQTAASINTNITDSGMTAEVGPETSYSKYVEYGTRKMVAEPFIKPAFDAQKGKFVSDLKKVTS